MLVLLLKDELLYWSVIHVSPPLSVYPAVVRVVTHLDVLSDVKQNSYQLVILYFSLDWLSWQLFSCLFFTDWETVDMNNKYTSFECELCSFAHLVVFAFGTGVVSDVFRILKWKGMSVSDCMNILLLLVLSFILTLVALEGVGSVNFEDIFKILKKTLFLELLF